MITHFNKCCRFIITVFAFGYAALYWSEGNKNEGLQWLIIAGLLLDLLLPDEVQP